MHVLLRGQRKANKVDKKPPVHVAREIVPVPVTVKKQEEQPPIKIEKVQVPSVNLDITAVIINFHTADLTKQAVITLRNHYKDLPIILVDNGSNDRSTKVVQRLGKKKGIKSIVYQDNLGHGPAMDKAFELVKTRYVFTMDSDCIVHKKGFLEKMQREMMQGGLYAIGWKRWTDKLSGVPREWCVDNPNPKRFVAYIHPAASLYDLSVYRKLRPFFHHGAPCLENMVDANAKGLKVKSFPIFKDGYVQHLIAGTRRMYGGRWNPKPTDRPGNWNEKTSYPI